MSLVMGYSLCYCWSSTIGKEKERSRKIFGEYVGYCRSRWKSSPHVSGYGILPMLLLESHDRQKKGGPDLENMFNRGAITTAGQSEVVKTNAVKPKIIVKLQMPSKTQPNTSARTGSPLQGYVLSVVIIIPWVECGYLRKEDRTLRFCYSKVRLVGRHVHLFYLQEYIWTVGRILLFLENLQSTEEKSFFSRGEKVCSAVSVYGEGEGEVMAVVPWKDWFLESPDEGWWWDGGVAVIASERGEDGIRSSTGETWRPSLTISVVLSNSSLSWNFPAHLLQVSALFLKQPVHTHGREQVWRDLWPIKIPASIESRARTFFCRNARLCTN